MIANFLRVGRIELAGTAARAPVLVEGHFHGIQHHALVLREAHAIPQVHGVEARALDELEPLPGFGRRLAGEVVQESVLNSLCSADAMDGRDGNRAEAFPYELLERMGLPEIGQPPSRT